MKKIIFIINGKGRSGKDTVCELASTMYRTRNISSITPITNIAKHGSWNGETTALTFEGDLYGVQRLVL